MNAIQNSFSPSNAKVSVGSFQFAASVNQDLTCRLMGPISVAPSKTIPAYIKEALQEELFLARAYDPTSPIAITGQIQELSFSLVSPGSWNLALLVSSSQPPAGDIVSVDYQ